MKMKRPNNPLGKPLGGFKKFVSRRKPTISEVVREPTAGGIIFRRDKDSKDVEILLIQDAKNRWTIPKGHIEEGESSKQTAEREIREETGLQEMKILNWLGKINFRYRRQQSLVLMTTEIFLVQAQGDTNDLKPEEWMNGIKWFPAAEALDKIEYEDIGKIILLALKKIRDGKL
jgi:8-oxo-dGTP pyrophosphatase MutT (NUDIX family)